MRRKSLAIIIIAGIVWCSNITVNFVDVKSNEFQSINVNITSIQWVHSEHYSDETRSIFEFTVNSTVYNPNDPIELRFPTYPKQMFGTSASITLENNRLDHDFWCSCGSMQQLEMNATIPAGEKNHSTISYFSLEKKGITIIPDGRYVFWMYLFSYGESLLNSTRAFMRIQNGVPTYNFNYTPTDTSINLAIFRFNIIGLTIVTIAILVFKFKRNKYQSKKK